MPNPLLQIRVTPELLERYQRTAAHAGLKLNDWIRAELGRASERFAAAPPSKPQATTPASPVPAGLARLLAARTAKTP